MNAALPRCTSIYSELDTLDDVGFSLQAEASLQDDQIASDFCAILELNSQKITLSVSAEAASTRDCQLVSQFDAFRAPDISADRTIVEERNPIVGELDAEMDHMLLAICSRVTAIVTSIGEALDLLRGEATLAIVCSTIKVFSVQFRC